MIGLRTVTEGDTRARVDELLAAHDPRRLSESEFLGAQYDAGLAWVHFEAGRGGLGAHPSLQRLVDSLLEAAGAPNGIHRNPIGYGHGAGVIHTYGTDKQKERWLRPLFTCEELWCQLFSEPGAGSDLASLATMAIADGEEWAVSGQKIWSSGAHSARWGLLLARSDPCAAKHRGLSLFALDMTSPGVMIRPIRDMTGAAHFNEIFLDEVRVSDSHRLGAVGMGWSAAITTLMFERVLISDMGSDIEPHARAAISELRGSSSLVERARMEPLVELWIESRIVELMTLRAKQLQVAGQPGPDGSLGKLASTRLKKKAANMWLDLIGPAGQVGIDYDWEDGAFGAGLTTDRLQFLNGPSQTIQGGTSEVMLNIVAERVLALPSEPRPDKDVPWNETRRS